MQHRRRAALCGVLAVLGGTAILAPTASALDPVNTKKLRDAVTVNGILRHERVLQSIANANGGIRASGTPGFEASADYVKRQLVQAGYKVSEQTFEFPFFQQTADPVFERVSPTPRTFTGDEFATMTYSGSGDATAALQAVDVVVPIADNPPNTSTSGCEAADFAGFTAGNIALMQRGTCSFGVKAANAQAAGATAAVIFNEGQPASPTQPEDRTVTIQGTLGAPGVTIPVVGTSYAIGAELTDQTRAGAVTVHVSAQTISETRTTRNVIGDYTKGGGDATQTILLGSHLDSVTEGPGINDNGSGTATDLETAIQVAKLGLKPKRALRFAFWGAEEEGTLGSQHYVDTLGDAVGDIYANLNFDMLASPNYVRFVYDGDNSSFPVGGTTQAGPAGSGQIEKLFNDYFAGQGLPTDPTAFDGRSDYGPFIAVGIPAGGLFSGAEGKKTAAQAATYGGVADQPYDACYHQACDTTTNLNTKAINELGDGVAHAAWTLAKSKSGLFEDQSLRARKAKAKALKAKTLAGDQAMR
jgi:Zn-dependent M28 family amino/carboxypeptidase